MRPDLAIIGGGIVGLGTALAIQAAHPSLQITILEKEAEVGRHQTGHNSGVVHSGIYYKPGSLKASLCVDGAARMRAFCETNGLAYDAVGKVIVATEPDELPRLDALWQRGQQNGVPGLRLIDADELRRIEPHAAGIRAIHSPATAITDYGAVAVAMRTQFEGAGGQVVTGAALERVRAGHDGVTLGTTAGPVEASWYVACAGLYADRIARMAGVAADVTIVPFRGEYYMIRPERHDLVRGLIYPVPDPTLPFLGVHFTRTVDGQVEAGPNAVLAFDREGYTLLDVSLADTAQTLSFPGFWRLASRFWQTGVYEYYRSFSKVAFVNALRRLVPDIGMDDVYRGGAGVRAQALGSDGALLDDFVVRESPRALHVLNAPSPAATASLAIGRYLEDKASSSFGL